MKQLLVLTTLMSSLLMSSVAYADWTKLGKDPTGNTDYVDYKTVKERNGNYVIWLLKNSFVSSNSLLILFEMDCNLIGHRMLQATNFDELFASGSSWEPNYSKKWEYPVPNSYYNKLLKRICRKID